MDDDTQSDAARSAPSAQAHAAPIFHGFALSPGVCSGIVVYHEEALPARSHGLQVEAHDIDRELALFEEALAVVLADLTRTIRELADEGLGAEAEIFGVHVAVLEDDELRRQVATLIRESRHAADEAVSRVLADHAATLRSRGSPHWSDRAADLEELAARIRRALARDTRSSLGDRLAPLQDPVLAVDEVTPSQVLTARSHGVRALLTARGTGLSHAAILARSLGIPMLRVPHLASLRRYEGTTVTVDADRGMLLVATAERPAVATAMHPVGSQRSPRPTPELPCSLWLSVAHPSQLVDLAWEGTAGIGLYRTETLFLEASDFPTEEEQTAHYRSLFERAGERPVTLRTLDLGGDKTIPYLRAGPESNPFLGLRAHRLFRFHPDLLITQLRAMLRAASGGHRLRILFPMVASLEEWYELRRWTDESVASLRVEGAELPERVELGVLVETPAAALAFPDLIAAADFASIGTNDLVQFLFGVERGNADVADLYRPEHPVVLRMLAGLAGTAREAGKPLSVCGEVASDPDLAPLLVGLGIDHLSVPVTSLDPVRGRLGALTAAECRKRAREALAATTATEVRARFDGHPAGLAPPRVAASGDSTDPAVDPVCGMTVEPGRTPFKSTRRGITRYFCSARCLIAFERDGALDIAPAHDVHSS